MKFFLKNQRLLIIYSSLIVLITYGVKLINNSYAVDTMHLMTNYTGYLKHWISIGRPGLVLLKILTYGYVNLYFLNVFSLITFVAAILLICYYVDLLIKKTYDKRLLFIIPSIFATHQLFSEQFYFTLQSFEFALGVCLVTSVLIAFVKLKHTFWKILCILVLAFTFTIYQSFFAYAVTLFLFKLGIELFEKQRTNEHISFNAYVLSIGKIIGINSLALVLSQLFVWVAKKMFHVESSYLNNMIHWGTRPFMDCVNEIKDFASELLFPPIGNTFFTPLFGLIVIVFLAIIGKMIVSREKNTLYIACTLLFFCLTPFIFALLGGGRPIFRGEVPNFPLVLSLGLLFIALYIETVILKKILLAVVIFFTFIQLRETTNLLYADQQKYEEDVRLSEMIVNKIYAMDLDEPSSYSLIIYGSRGSQNVSAKIGETNGISLYAFAPNSLHSSHMVLVYLNTLGINFQYPTPEECEKYQYYQEEMSTWPNKDSIKVVDHFIIVNLSK